MVFGSTHYLNVYADSGWRFSDESQTEPYVAIDRHRSHSASSSEYFETKEFYRAMKNLAVPPPIVDLPGFSNALIFDDTLHVAWRGFAADFLASSLIDMFGKGAALQKTCDMAGHWAKARGYSLSIDEFSLSDDRFPSLNAKGYEIKLLCVWLAA